MMAELIITNARVQTMDEALPRAEAVAVAAGRILAVGSCAEIAALAGPQTRVIDAGGRSLLPGFVESHLHLVLGGNELSQLQLGGVEGFEPLKAAFEAYAAANPARALLMAPDKAKVPEEPAVLYALSTGLAAKATPDNMERVVKYALRMPAEFQVLLVKDAVTRDNSLTNTKSFNEWAAKNSNVLF